MENKLTVEDRDAIFAHMEGVMFEATQLMEAQKISSKQMLIVDCALAIIRAALRLQYFNHPASS